MRTYSEDLQSRREVRLHRATFYLKKTAHPAKSTKPHLTCIRVHSVMVLLQSSSFIHVDILVQLYACSSSGSCAVAGPLVHLFTDLADSKVSSTGVLLFHEDWHGETIAKLTIAYRRRPLAS